jgi:hypothetical protein
MARSIIELEADTKDAAAKTEVARIAFSKAADTAKRRNRMFDELMAAGDHPRRCSQQMFSDLPVFVTGESYAASYRGKPARPRESNA